jgi:hypothetical protein
MNWENVDNSNAMLAWWRLYKSGEARSSSSVVGFLVLWTLEKWSDECLYQSLRIAYP